MTLILQILGTAALVYLGSFVAWVVWMVLSGRRERRRAREAKAAAVRDHLPDAAEMVGAVVFIGDTPAELVSFDLKLPAGIPESEAYLWN